jgi:hypothetical protein
MLPAAVAVVDVAVAAEHRTPLGHRREHRDRTGDRRGDGRDEDVAILDVAQLVGEDAFRALRRS